MLVEEDLHVVVNENPVDALPEQRMPLKDNPDLQIQLGSCTSPFGVPPQKVDHTRRITGTQLFGPDTPDVAPTYTNVGCGASAAMIGDGERMRLVRGNISARCATGRGGKQPAEKE
ncbi:MAG: hypothetical protein QNI99_04645 [Woeseiaceae bacterium]|nr:hypothetical protein [Woeseiaceae bacterium]